MQKSAPNYNHNPLLGHRFYALTRLTDCCEYCGCWVGDVGNGLGKSGGRFYDHCRMAPAQPVAQAMLA